MTPKQLELCRRAGLVRETAAGVFELTYAGRKLLGEKPPAARVESNDEWLSRVEAMRPERRNKS